MPYLFDEKTSTALLEKRRARVAKKTGTRPTQVIDEHIKRQADTREFNIRAEKRLVRSMANDCSPLPAILNPARRQETELSLKLFSELYFPNKFYLGWSTSHLELIHEMERSVLHGGGTLSFALPRGSGKTSIAETCALWVLLHGHKKFVLCIGAKGDLGKHLFQSIRSEIENNELLLEDFPEVCYPFHFAEHNPIKFRHQHCDGSPTLISYGSSSLSLPEIDSSKASGSYILCTGITSGLRGLKRTTLDGTNIRPDFVIIDDPQTDKSAKSPASTAQRERIISGAIMGLAGPRKPITVVMPCTVIQRGDLADKFLDRQLKPEWRGQRSKLLPKFPTNRELWQKYQEIKNDSFRAGNRGEEATEFYSINRVAMDEGAEVTWVERYDPPWQISAIQHAMDLYYRDPVAFASEYQNEPLEYSDGSDRPSIEIKSTDVIQRLSGLPYGTCPRDTLFVTSGVDVQKDVLFYVTVAWTEDFGGVILDYGSCPEQPKDYYDTHNIYTKLSDKWPGLLQSPVTYKGLEHLRDRVFSRLYQRDESDATVPVDGVFVDANWNLTADAVYSFCKANSGKFHPCHGKGIGAAMLPMEQWVAKKGERKNKANWIIRTATLGANRGRHITYDTNFWKSRVGERLVSPLGTTNGLLLYGTSQLKHLLIADHLSAEIPIRTHGRGRDVDEWRTRASTSENHMFDCLVLAAVAASHAGLELLEITNTIVDEQNTSGDRETTRATAIVIPPRRVAATPPPRKN